MASLKQRVKDKVAEVRERRPFVDHLVRMIDHYGDVKGNLQAGAVTYFAFLSFFPILALAFAVIGYVAKVYPDAQRDLVKAIGDVLPGMVSMKPVDGKIAISEIQAAAPGILTVGLPVMLYSGLGWLSAMRDALLVVFEKPEKEQPSFVVGKGKDVVALLVLGFVLMFAVAVSGVITSAAKPVLEFFQLGVAAEPLVWVLAIALGLGANTLLFLAFFKLLGDPDEPIRSLLAGAVLGAVGFELLKLLSSQLIKSTAGQPAFQAFGIALILVVWFNYFSRVVMYSAAWAHTTPEARRIREEEALRQASMEELARVDLHETAEPEANGKGGKARTFAAGGAAGLAAAAVLRKKKDDS